MSTFHGYGKLNNHKGHMTKFAFDIGIIGGGAAGLTVAAGAAQLGARTLLVEREEKLGGDCLHFGCVPSKTLIQSASVYHHIKTSSCYGLPEITPPPVIFRDISARIHSVIETIQHHDSVERFCGLGVKVEFGRCKFIDQHTIEIGGRTYDAGKWVIASGSSAAIPPIKGLHAVQYITNREIFSLATLPDSLIILGAGPIAVEMAQAFCRLGSKVDIIQRSDQILTKEDKDLADAVMAGLRHEGVTIHLNATIEKVSERNGFKTVTFTNNQGRTITLTAEQLLVALGRQANIDGLGLRNIGLELDPKGIKVDGRLRTSLNHIYAAGDVTGAYQFTHAAGYEGGVVLSNAVFRLPRKTNYSFLPWCTYTEPELASIGLNEKRAREQGIEYTVWTERFHDNDRAQAEGAPAGQLKLLLNRKEKPIGVQILGLHGGELIHEWVAAMNGKIRLSTLASAIHPYPTLGEINKKVAGSVLSRKLFSEKVRKALTFFFNLKGRACEPDNPGD